jgi:uncharacterized protein
MKFTKLSILFFLTAVLASAQTKTFIDQPYLEVEASADTLVAPNEIYLKINLNESDFKDKISLEVLESMMINVLKSTGINVEKDLSIATMSSNFNYYAFKPRSVAKSRQFDLKVSDASTAAKVFLELEKIKISNTRVYKVDHTELQFFKKLMLSKAMLLARERAVAMTKPFNQSIGAAIHITDSKPQTPITDFPQRNYHELAVRSKFDLAGASSEDSLPNTNIEFEKIKVTQTVNVVFLLK